MSKMIDTVLKSYKNLKKKTINIPNRRLIKAIEEVEAIECGKINAKRYKTFEEALEDLD